ncbi:MAG: hypothetical protein D6807_00275 [Alphaproteobacteria bacterium]|nr:MAG: hypothetical protein D6807_00275 [Alphaproteobacteria bacterium]
MPRLRVDLQDGFDGEAVRVELDGTSVFRRENVRTRYQVGLADVIERAVSEGRHVLAIRLPRHNAAWQETIDVKGETHVGVSLSASGTLEVTVEDRPFRYA